MTETFRMTDDELRAVAYEIFQTRRPAPEHLGDAIRAFAESGDDPYEELFACLLAGADDEVAGILEGTNIADAAYVAAVVIVGQCEGYVDGSAA